MKGNGRPLRAVLAAASLLALARPAPAFWLLGFSPAPTLPGGSFGFISGTGGQFTRVGDPEKSSLTPALAHAGFRLGLTDRLDAGYRLCTVPLPYSSVGPSLGSELDAKLLLTEPYNPWQAALVVGGAYADLVVAGQAKTAWSPGADLVFSRDAGRGRTPFLELRYVYTEIPSAPGGSADNHVQAFGPAAGVKLTLTPQLSLIPELGLFDFIGRLSGQKADGWGLQIGAVLSVGGLPKLW